MIPKKNGIMRDVYFVMAAHERQTLRQIHNKVKHNRRPPPSLVQVKRAVSTLRTRGDLEVVAKKGQENAVFAMNKKSWDEARAQEEQMIRKRLKMERLRVEGMWGETHLHEVKQARLTLVLENLVDGPKTAKKITEGVNNVLTKSNHLTVKQVGRVLGKAKTKGYVRRDGHVWSILTVESKKKKWSVAEMVENWNEGGREAYKEAKSTHPIQSPSLVEKAPERAEITPTEGLSQLDSTTITLIAAIAAGTAALTTIVLRFL